MIVFNNITLRGFRTYASDTPFTYDLQSMGLHLIQGENGAGKSTILHALYWALYGKFLKENLEIEPWKDKRAKGFKGTLVEVNFYARGRQVQITRCKKYKGLVGDMKGNSGLFIKVNGEYENKGRDIHEGNKRVIELLGVEPHLFKAAIVFGQNMERLINQKNTDQKKVFEDMFDSYFINEAREVAKGDLDKLVAKLAGVNQDLVIKQSEYNHIKTHHKTLKERLADLESADEYALEEWRNKLDTLKSDAKKKIKELSDSEIQERSDINNTLNKLSSLEWKQERLERDIESYTKEGVTIQNAINEYKRNKAKKICENCGQKLDPKSLAKRNKSIDESIGRLQVRYKEWVDKLGQARTELKNLNIPSEKEVDELNERFKELDDNLRAIEKQKQQKHRAKEAYYELLNSKPESRNETKIKQVNTDLAKYKKLGMKVSKELKELKKTAPKLEKQVASLRWVVDYALSNKGLKNYILSELIGQLNDLLRGYAQETGLLARFEIEMDKASKGVKCWVYQGEHERRYEDLSGGQKQLVNVCVAFALNDLYSELNPCTLLFLDEVFESLSRNNIDIVVNIIKRKAKGKSVHLITHREEFMISHSKILQLPIRMR